MVFNELQNLYIADIHPSMQHAIHLTDWFSLYGVIQFFFRTRTIPHVSNCCRGKQAILNRRMQKTVVSEKARDPQVTIGVNTKAVEFWMIWGFPWFPQIQGTPQSDMSRCKDASTGCTVCTQTLSSSSGTISIRLKKCSSTYRSELCVYIYIHIIYTYIYIHIYIYT